MFGLASYGQFGSWGDSGDSGGWGDTSEDKKEKSDDTASDSSDTEDEWGSSSDGDWGSAEGFGESGGSSYNKPVSKKREFKNQEKVLLPYDSIRKLIIYRGI